MEQQMSLMEMKLAFPEEWVLVGNPVTAEGQLQMSAGIPLLHSKDKKEVCYLGRDKAAGFEKVTLIFTGEPRTRRKMTGIFNRVKS